MGNADSIPVVSQLKSAVQAASGDLAGAEETQQRFIRQCPFVAQATSAVQAAMGDLHAAEQTQREFISNVSTPGQVEAVPVMSQIKSAIQAAKGDLAGAEETQQRFIRECPVVAQGTSAVQAAMGDLYAAEQTQHQFMSHLPNSSAAIAASIAFPLAVCGGGFEAARERSALWFSSQLQKVLEESVFVCHCVLSASGQPQCFLGESLLRRAPSGDWAMAQNVNQGEFIYSAKRNHVEVQEKTVHPKGFCSVVRLCTANGSLTVTGKHRVMAWKGGQKEAVPADTLRKGDDVCCIHMGNHAIEKLLSVDRKMLDVEVFEFKFKVDEEVESFLQPCAMILSKGKKKKTRRGSGHAANDDVSFPDTEWEFPEKNNCSTQG